MIGDMVEFYALGESGTEYLPQLGMFKLKLRQTNNSLTCI